MRHLFRRRCVHFLATIRFTWAGFTTAGAGLRRCRFARALLIAAVALAFARRALGAVIAVVMRVVIVRAVIVSSATVASTIRLTTGEVERTIAVDIAWRRFAAAEVTALTAALGNIAIRNAVAVGVA